jgi:hypothetical protein
LRKPYQRNHRNSVISIGEAAFADCKRLTAINIADDNTAYSSQDGVLYNKNKTTLIKYPVGKMDVSLTIPNSVTNIEKNAFRDCTCLENVTIPDSVTSIGINAFRDCTGLAKVTIPNNITGIEDCAFIRCTNLKSVTFQGTIPLGGFTIAAFEGDLRDKFYATDAANGTPGTYITTAPVNYSSVWTKQ